MDFLLNIFRKYNLFYYFTFKLKDKFGLLDANLNIIIPANYETLEVNKFGKIYAQIDRADFERQYRVHQP